MSTLLYIIPLLYGCLIGSFLNVLIYRVPKGENFVTTRSHCMSCGYQLKWYDLVPIASFALLKGRCRNCRTKLSIQYPAVEAGNGLLYLLIFYKFGFTINSVIYALVCSALLTLSMIDFKTYEIPVGINYFIAGMGLIHMLLDLANWKEYMIGACSVSLFILILIIATKGQGMGGGDMKLMAAAGLLLGWKLIILAFILACFIGSVCHIIRMKLSNADHVLAMGPYLSIGILISLLYGEQMIALYINYVFR